MKIGVSYKQKPVEGKYDAIVIGSGLGGLSTAAILSKEGKKALVLEKHYTAGGFTHTFTRKDYEWDVGLHYVGSVEKKERILRRLFDYVTNSQLDWADMGEVYDRIIFGEKEYPLVKGLDNFKNKLKEYFPSRKDQDAIDDYTDTVYKASVAGRSFYEEKGLAPIVSWLVSPFMRMNYLKYARLTTLQVMLSITDNKELIGVLTGQYGDYGLPPSESSFAMHAMVVKHYLNGGSYPVGGSGRIAATIAPVIEQSGGKIYTNAEVTEIIIREGNAVGVKMADGNEILSDVVISGAGIENTYNYLLPQNISANLGLKQQTNLVRPSASHISLYIGLKHTAKELGLRTANYWIYPDNYDHDQNLRNFLKDPSGPLPVTYISFPSAKDPDFENRYPGRSTIEIIGFAPYQWFEKWENTKWKKRGEDYEKFKEEISQRLLAQLYRFEPQVKGKIDTYELSTPLSTRNFANYHHGEIYGIAHSPDRFELKFLRAHTPIRNLFLTGQDIVTAGIGAALLSGVITASAITRKNLGKKIIMEMEPAELG